ncbi:hypothetical protein DSO57_1020420 [Entomophthora muscae]|uniref:Uncharacterized protein n=1 Tax=Entomophthora muscae TaxID=34485 RepID=A0ACC2RUT6_9FUNG|nr:hypothetical protein DSO57_1020420 [Entomophthora muscae]
MAPVSEENDLPRSSNANSVPGVLTNFGGAHLTDFTKRKNWPLRVLGELKDFLHVVSPSGRFLFCSPSSLEMVGYSPEELVGRNITEFIHVDDIDTFIRDFNLAITQKTFKLFYRFRKKDDKFIVLEVNGHPYFPDGSTNARCFFIMARPYPSKAAAMIDSFLELRMENEILTRRLQELKRETEEQSGSGDDAPTLAIPPPPPTNPLMQTIPFATGGSSESGGTPSVSNNGNISASVVASVDSEAQRAKKKLKKAKVDEEIHVCTDCGTVDSPEWRKGPQGPKTLCNACGLRYAKRSRKNKASMPEDD